MVTAKNYLDFVDVSVLNDYDYVICDPDVYTDGSNLNSQHTSPVNPDTGSADNIFQTTPKCSMAQVTASCIDTGPADDVCPTIPECSMAQVSKASISPPRVNPFGNPFESEIFFDTEKQGAKTLNKTTG